MAQGTGTRAWSGSPTAERAGRERSRRRESDLLSDGDAIRRRPPPTRGRTVPSTSGVLRPQDESLTFSAFVEEVLQRAGWEKAKNSVHCTVAKKSIRGYRKKK